MKRRSKQKKPDASEDAAHDPATRTARLRHPRAVPHDRHPLYSLSLPLITLGLVAQAGGWLLRWSFPTAGALVSAVATVMLIVGLAYRAMDKGRSPVWGLCGLFSVIGVIIVGVLTNRTNRTAHN